MRARRFLQRAGKEFVRVLMWCLVAYAPFGAVLVALMGASLTGLTRWDVDKVGKP
jgi:hypothetical protein